MKLKNILLSFFICFGVIACSEKDLMLFDLEESGIYFQYGGQTRFYINIDAYYDSLAFSFSSAPIDATDTILTTRIRTMGKVKEYPRPVKLSIDKERTTMIEGTHFDIDFNAAVVPAGESEFRFPVKFYRTADMLDEKFALVLKVEPNEHFNIYFQTQKNTNVYTSVGATIDADRFKFIVSEIYTKPFYWAFADGTYGANVLGTWTVEKYKFINSEMNWTVEDWNNAGGDSPVQFGRFAVSAMILRQTLQNLADSGNPMREADGSFMQLGPDYMVDYSAYL